MVKLYLSSQTQTLTNVHERGSWAGRAYTFQLLAGRKIWIDLSFLLHPRLQPHCPPSLFWRLCRQRGLKGTALSSLFTPGCFSSLCVGPFCPLCLEFLPKPLPQPPPLPFLLHRFRLSSSDLFSRSQPQLGRKPLFACVSLSLHHHPVRECSIV